MRRAWLPALCAVLQVVSVGTGSSSPSVPVGAAFLLLGLAAAGSLTWRDRFAIPVLAFCALAYVGQVLLLAPPVPAALAVVCYELARRPHPPEVEAARRSASVVASVGSAVVAGGAAIALSGELALVAPFALVVVTATALGLLLASHDAREESRRRELLHEQRLRIARDLHDAVGHGVGAISVQAGAARLALAAGAAGDAAAAVGDIETASRALLREVRWLVGLLRDDTESPGLHGLDGLLDSARRSGIDLRVERTGTAGDVPPATGEAAYRILQEALTNVLRHGYAHRAEIQLRVGDTLDLAVCNPCAAVVPRSAGHGLVGMRERAEAVGGTVRTGPEPGGRWVVEARLPLAAPR